MAKQQRLMAISQQAASMQGQAQQYKYPCIVFFSVSEACGTECSDLGRR